MTKPLFIVAALVGVLTPQFASAQAITPSEQRAIDQVVAKAMARSQTPSVSIAVVRGDRLVMAKAYGKASETIPVATPALPYQIASISKQFTAMAMLLLEDEGKLSLDDTVSKYVPGITGGSTITLRQLLSHTSGLQDYWPQDYSFADMAHPVTPQRIVERWARKPLNYVPGSKWQYSNTGFVVAGLVVEKVAGMPLLEFLQQRIFRPLGMTSVLDQDLAIGPTFPQGYGRAALGPVRVAVPAARGWLYAAGELSMTAADLAKWDIARIDRTLVPRDDWDAQERTTLLTDGNDTHYGLGVSLGTSGGHRRITHTGEAVGFLSSNAVYPDDKAAVVVLTNSWSGGATGEISRGITNIILPGASVTDPTAAARDVAVRSLFDQLRTGRIDRQMLTTNANYYFTPTVIDDYRSSIAPLGAPNAIEPNGASSLRGGFVIQGYTIRFPQRTLNLSVFTEPGNHGRIEQYLITPGE